MTEMQERIQGLEECALCSYSTLELKTWYWYRHDN